jgi:hypothetical protein
MSVQIENVITKQEIGYVNSYTTYDSDEAYTDKFYEDMDKHDKEYFKHYGVSAYK